MHRFDRRGRGGRRWCGLPRRAWHGCEALECRRMLAAGDLDPSFSVDGRVVTAFSGYKFSVGAAVALQSDRRIVVAGSALNSPASDFALARYNPDGTLDGSFGTSGRVVTSPASRLGDADLAETASAVSVQGDGKILVAGYGQLPGSSGNHYAWLLVRYNADGSVDSSFGTNGVAYATFFSESDDSYLYAMRLDGTGGIVCAGLINHKNASGSTVSSSGVVGRILPGGSFDSAFNGSGYNILPISGYQYVDLHALALQGDGKVVVGGYLRTSDSTLADFGVARLNADGTLDDNFGLSGRVRTAVSETLGKGPGSDTVAAVAVAPDGRIWAAGHWSTSVAGGWGFARYLTDGSPDTGFGTQGVESVGDMTGNVYGMALQGDGKAVAVGLDRALNPHMIVARLNADDGSLDASFGAGAGLVAVAFPDLPDWAVGNAVALQPDGRIVAFGWAENATTGAFAVARLLDNPASSARVTGMWASGSAWSAPFLQNLAATGAGSATFGFALAADPANQPPLPWINLDTLALKFAGPVPAGLAGGAVTVSAGGAPLAVQSVAASPADETVLLVRLASPLPAGRVRLAVAGVQNAAGQPLDVTVPVLPGDVNRSGIVLADDFSAVKKKFFASPSAPGTGDAAYDAFHDVDGSGVILANDFSEVKKRFFTALPAPAVATVPSAELPAFSNTRVPARTARPPRRGVLDESELALPLFW